MTNPARVKAHMKSCGQANSPLIWAFYARLVAAGKPRMPPVGACVRKRVMLGYVVLRNRQPLEPHWAG